MGGPGSGRMLRWNIRPIIGSQHRIDIQWLKKHTYLKPGTLGTLSWSKNRERTGSIGYTIERDRMILSYRHKPREGDWEDIEQTIYFDWTPCNYGGKRIWFKCPHCGRRCAVVYGAGKYFSCRVCCNLTYKTCNETPWDRRFSKANKLREKIEAKPGCFNDLPLFKPKGMHQKTWNRIRNQIQHLEGIGIMELEKNLGCHPLNYPDPFKPLGSYRAKGDG